MITIERNGSKLQVSKGAYNIYFKDIGYKVVNENKAEVKKTEIKEETKKETKVKKSGDK